MKHLRASLVLAVFLTAIFGGFTHTEKVFAATSQLATANINKADPDAVFNWADNFFFYDINTALQANLQANKSSATTTETTKATITAVNNAKTAFETTFANEKGSKPVSDVYKDALNAAIQSLTVTSSNPILQRPEAASLITQEVTRLTAEATSQDYANGVSTQNTANIATSTLNAYKSAVNTANPVTIPPSCGSLITDFLGCISAGAAWIIKTIFLNIVGFALVLSAQMLSYAMFHGIFEFKNFAPDSIYAIWLVVRQIVSLFVFFAGLFVGFMAIIGKSEDFKKYLAFLVIFGLFVNFSYPMVRVFVDISNVVSLQIYQTTFGNDILSDAPKDSAGSRIMARMGLESLAASAASPNKNPQGTSFTDQISTLPGALAAVGFVGYAAYIFFMAAFLIVARTALLVCIIIASPILLVDTVVPALGEKAKWLRGMFVSQLFVAPVFTIMLALTLKFLNVFSVTTTSTAAFFFNLIMMLVMLHIMLKVTKAVAGGVGETVTKWAGKAGGLGTGMTIGLGAAGLGFAGRQTLGRAGEYLGQQGGVVGDLGRKMAGGKYDLRNLSGAQSLAQTAGITGMGKGADKNRKAAETARDEENAKIAQGIGDDSERELFLRRKFSTGGISGFTGKEPTSKAYKNFTKDEEDVLKKYISADDERRKEMMGDDKNKRFAQRFKTIDGGATTTLSENLQKALSDKLAKDKAADVRNTDRIANYLTANQATRESIYANAVAADDKNLLKQLAVMDKLVTQPAGTITEDAVRALGDEALAQKVLANDLVRAGAQKAQENQATVAQAQAEAQKIIQDAQLSAAQAQKEAAQSTSAALASLAQSQNDLAQQIKNLVTS